MLLGIDTGGTFTDFVLVQNGQLRVHKVLSTPAAPERAILQGIDELGIDLQGLRIVHGSTVATNALLERKGVKTAFITNHGLGDMLSIGRQAREQLYNLQPPLPAEPVPQELCWEVGGRLGADGGVVEPLEEDELSGLLEKLEQYKPEAVAINLLFSFLDDRFERAIEQRLEGKVFVSRSSAVLPEYKEYERGVSTWLNAYVGPLVKAYIDRLGKGVAPAGLAVMQSSAGTMSAEHAGGRGVNMLLSGPAGGLMAARHMGVLAECEQLLTFDMGGTSTDVALIDGDIRLTSEGCIGGFPVAVPMVDMHTIGAGGGSIAYVDEGGLLQVGPESAGARPGPVCYGRGGTQPTVTDANLVLGRLRSDAFLGGDIVLDAIAAREAMKPLAEQLRLSIETLAEGIVRIANEHMARALRVISVQRGIDPRGFQLMCFGGAGGLHVCALADAMGMQRAVVPVHGGVLSALGMLVAPRSRELSRTFRGDLQSIDHVQLAAVFDELSERGRRELIEEGVAPDTIREQQSLDLRYTGQSYTLNLPWSGIEVAVEAFHDSHARRFGHKLGEAVELVNVRLNLVGPMPEINLSPWIGEGDLQRREVEVFGVGKVPLWQREQLAAGQVLSGPALIAEQVSTTYLAPDWRAVVDEWGNLLLSR